MSCTASYPDSLAYLPALYVGKTRGPGGQILKSYLVTKFTMRTRYKADF